MFLRQFHYLVALEQEGHFGRAAKRCHVSQPSLSSAIKQLEEELDIPIILRHQRFQGFTEEGRRVIEWSKRILADRDGMLEELAIMRENLRGCLRIGAMPMSSPVLPIIERLFASRHPKVRVDIQFMGIEQMQLALKNFELDIGVTYLENQPLERLNKLPLYEERLSLLLPEHHPLNGEDSITWAKVAELPLCLLSPSMYERQMMDQAFASAGCQPEPRVESNSIFQLAFHVMKGDLATVIPSHFMQVAGGFPGTRRKLLEEPVVSQNIGLVWIEGNPILPMAKAVVDLMDKVLRTETFDKIFAGDLNIAQSAVKETLAPDELAIG